MSIVATYLGVVAVFLNPGSRLRNEFLDCMSDFLLGVKRPLLIRPILDGCQRKNGCVSNVKFYVKMLAAIPLCFAYTGNLVFTRTFNLRKEPMSCLLGSFSALFVSLLTIFLSPCPSTA